MENIVYIVITSIASIISGILVFMLKNIISKLQQKDIVNKEEHAKEEYLILRSINALGKLTVANSIALRDEKMNSDFGTALSEYREIEKNVPVSDFNTHQKGIKYTIKH